MGGYQGYLQIFYHKSEKNITKDLKKVSKYITLLVMIVKILQLHLLPKGERKCKAR